MILPIVKIGTPLLRRKTAAVPSALAGSKGLKKLLGKMAATMRHADGVGLAANQVGVNLRLFAMESQKNRRYPKAPAFPLRFYLNAKIVKASKKKVRGWEGCLSIPGYRGLVPRHEWLTFTALTPEGARVRRTVRGFEARVIQHEIDHLNGFFYMDRMKGLRDWFHLDLWDARFRPKVRGRGK
ncbi:MAG TPA: peptide deformylase [bacterium]|nr:peptide deformylase [bacterium]